VPGGVPATSPFTPGEHDIPEEQTPDVVPSRWRWCANWRHAGAQVASVCTARLCSRTRIARRSPRDHALGALQELARAYPDVSVDPDSLFVQDGPFHHRCWDQRRHRPRPRARESDYGPDVARRVARWMVVFPPAPGGQRSSVCGPRRRAPYRRDSARSWTPCRRSSADQSIATMADRAAVSERHLVRMFRVQVGMTPARLSSGRDWRQPRSCSPPETTVRKRFCATSRIRVCGHDATHVPPRARRLTSTYRSRFGTTVRTVDANPVGLHHRIKVPTQANHQASPA